MNKPTDFIGEIHKWLAQYDDMAAQHAASLARYRDESPAYDEQRFTNTIAADEFLDGLAGHLRELAGPPVPGEVFTLTFAGSERHDGEQPYCFVVCGTDLDDARRTLTSLPSWKDWYEQQRGWLDPDDQAPDVVFVADQSHPGLPQWGAYDDLRREQAAALAETAGAPAVAAAEPLALTS
ncbi:hypothetical protein [Streptomyces bottropensis]|uniref:hypothetical protein n=1 Tax=Streptomyces bottropensis TaxID=42235 RepID=UPI0036D12147